MDFVRSHFGKMQLWEVTKRYLYSTAGTFLWRKSVKILRVAFFRGDFLQNPYFKIPHYQLTTNYYVPTSSFYQRWRRQWYLCLQRRASLKRTEWMANEGPTELGRDTGSQAPLSLPHALTPYAWLPCFDSMKLEH